MHFGGMRRDFQKAPILTKYIPGDDCYECYNYLPDDESAILERLDTRPAQRSIVVMDKYTKYGGDSLCPI